MRVSVNALCSRNNTFDEDVALWKRLDVRNVGLLAAKILAVGCDEAVRNIASTNLTVEYIVNPFYSRLDDDPAWELELAKLAEMIEVAHGISAPMIYVNSAPVGGLTWDEAAGRLGEKLGPSIAHAHSLGVEFALEPCHSSRPELGFVHTARDAFDLADRYGISVCLDLFVHWNERGLASTIKENLERLLLVQVSDFIIGGLCQPDRVPPGQGGLHMDRALNVVLGAGYKGVVDIELLGPRIDAMGYSEAIEQSLLWVRAFEAQHHRPDPIR